MADQWGIEPGFEDVNGRWHDTSSETRTALRLAMGGLADVDDPPPSSRPVWFVRHGAAPTMLRPALVVLEDGTEIRAGVRLPPDLPLGYHDLHPADGGPTTRLIVVPDRCAPAPERAAGLAVQLYSARSHRSWGIGDFADLSAIGDWGRGSGAPYMLCSPLHAPSPAGRQEPSPYFASSRLWRNPLHLSIEAVGGWVGTGDRAAELVTAGRALDSDRRIDRDRVWALKREALGAIWTDCRSGLAADASLAAFGRRGGPLLEGWACYCAIAEIHGPDWHGWPVELRRPDAPAVRRFALKEAEAVAFHVWVQWLADQQHAGVAAGGVRLIHDLAVGADPGGADGWLWQDVLAAGVRVGAPPDEFNTAGQDWGLPPFVPWKLRASGYEPLAALLGATARHADGLRIDHVMGLFRLFWIPAGGGPGDGGYVRYPGQELLDIVTLESVRAGTFVVGEDLGTVEDEVREALASRDVLSYRLCWFEEPPVDAWPRDAMAAVTTHDLPTIAGAWTGADAQAADFAPRLTALTGLGPDEPTDEVVVATHERLAASPCRLVVATLEDATGEPERPNVPGTTAERLNWSTALPVAIDDLDRSPLANAVLTTVTSHNRG